MRILLAIVIIAGLSGAGLAQGGDPSGGGMGGKRQQRAEKSKRKGADTARPVLDHSPYPKTDPWGDVREAPKSKK